MGFQLLQLVFYRSKDATLPLSGQSSPERNAEIFFDVSPYILPRRVLNLISISRLG